MAREYQRPQAQSNISRYGLGGRVSVIRVARSLPSVGIKDELLILSNEGGAGHGTLYWRDETAKAWTVIGTPGAAGNHNILSTTHPDTAAATVVRGDILVGNATPAWSRLARGASGTVLKSDGTDAAWSAFAHAIGGADHTGSLTAALHGTFAAGDLHTEYGAVAQAESVTGLWNFIASGLGGLTDYDITVGDVATPDYGIIRMGDSCMGRTSYNVASLDLDGAVIFRNMGGSVTGQIEFVWVESAGASVIRFALPKSGVGNATYNPRSMLLAGPAVNDDDVVTVGYWQGAGATRDIFHNLACDTGGDGADLGVQNDLEVEGDIFTDSIKESTTGAGVTFGNGLFVPDNEVVAFGNTAAAPDATVDFDSATSTIHWQWDSSSNQKMVLENIGAGRSDLSIVGRLKLGSSATPTVALDVLGSALISGVMDVKGVSTLTVAGLALDAQNTTNATSNQVAIFRGSNRITAANDDEAYLSFYLDDDAENQQEFARWTWIAPDTAAASKDGALRFDLMRADTLTIAGRIDVNLVAIGVGAGPDNTGARNVFIGTDAGLVNTSGRDCLFLGAGAGQKHTTGIGNIVMGKDAGRNLTSEQNNLFIGFEAGLLNTASNNTFIGGSAGDSNTTGTGGLFLGLEAGQKNTTGNSNTYIGFQAGKANTVGGTNTFIGALAGTLSTTNTAQNTFVGYNAGGANTDGFANVYLGRGAGDGMVSGSRNVFLGYGVDGSSNSIGASIGIGFNTIITANNQCVIGSADASGAITDAYIGSGVTKVSPAAITLQSTGGSGTNNAGADFILGGGKGTGNAAGGNILLQTAIAGGSGTTLQSLATKVTIGVGAETALLIAGSFGATLTAISSATTLDETHHAVVCDASGGAFTVTLPAASGIAGRIYHIKKIDSSGNAIIVDGNAAETIDGGATATISTQYESIQIICDGSNWHII